MGDLQRARSSCEARPDYYESWVCLTMTYDKLGRHAEAEATMARLVQLGGDASAYQYVQIRTQWGQQDAALSWLEKALRLRDPGLIYRAVEQALKFPG
jgi:tetratricopeptide (TPR) repeat protein